MSKLRIITLLAAVLLLVFSACKTEKKPDEQAFLNSLQPDAGAPAINNEMIIGILGQIPSPLEISSLLKQSGTVYNIEYLNPAGNSTRYNTNYKQALNLGVYGTDLGYINIYEKNSDGIRYLSSIKSLAEELHLGQFFDFETMRKLAVNSKNLDSLLLLTTQNFNSINSYLQTQQRTNLSVLFLVGGWIEAMEITCQVAMKNPKNKDLHETIGNQKIVLDQIMLLLSFYKNDAAMAEIQSDFAKIKADFDKIKITHVYKSSTVEVVDGVAVVKDNSTTTVSITGQDIENISSGTNALRNKIIS